LKVYSLILYRFGNKHSANSSNQERKSVIQHYARMVKHTSLGKQRSNSNTQIVASVAPAGMS